ncbi:hypothetical protein [Lacrimispora amygdalina]|uniref:hypothetical protein n=1 Tax=Lacrimispora amygdalina TaxID=253257 RepID=UPI001478F0C4|nr:hypothetical protein [Clostridium indicum]
METSIIKKSGETWTRFKVKTKEVLIYASILRKYVDITKPAKQSSVYTYFEVKGDLLNK